METESLNLKESKEGSIGVFGERKEKGEMMQLYHNLKKKEIFFKKHKNLHTTLYM